MAIPGQASTWHRRRRNGDTPRRRAIAGTAKRCTLMRYRAALHAAGLTQGFQWLDGSFLEHIELIEKRAPNDVDVVTFFRLPAGVSQKQLAAKAGTLLDHGLVKSSYRVDGYFVDLGMDAERLAQQSAYWYSVWSHQRSQLWKGFVQVNLAPIEDATAVATLAGIGERP